MKDIRSHTTLATFGIQGMIFYRYFVFGPIDTRKAPGV